LNRDNKPANVSGAPPHDAAQPGSLSLHGAANEVDPSTSRESAPHLDLGASETRDELLGILFEAIGAATSQTVTDDVLHAIDAYREAGFDAADGLKELFMRHAAVPGGNSIQIGTVIVRALERLGSPEAVKALKDIARVPSTSGDTLAQLAIDAIAKLTIDPDQLSQLLDIESSRTRNAIATGLQGKELTELSIRRLGELLRSDSWLTHNLVATAYATDRSTVNAQLKLELLLGALSRLRHLRNVEENELIWGSTAEEAALNSYIRALADMPGADQIIRDKLADATPGSAEHKLLALAAALRRQRVAYPFVLQIATEEKSGFLRSVAVRGLGIVGSLADIPLLEQLATADPYSRPGIHAQGGEPNVYPVRNVARVSIAELRKGAAAKK
jgi:hypothetical protein